MKNLFLFISCLTFSSVFSQEIKGRVLDKSNNEPIPFANVLLSENYGVITNEEGFFVLQQKDFSNNTAIAFSCMGFIEQKITLQDFNQGQTVYLEAANNLLPEIVLRDTNLSVDQVMKNMTDNLSKNHDIANKRIQFFMRTKTSSQLQKANFELDKAAGVTNKEIKEINEAIKSKELVKIQPFTSFSEKVFNAYYGADSTKVSYLKHLNLTNPEKDNSSDGTQAKIMKRVFQNLESNNTFNIRSGIIPVAKKVKLSDFISKKNDTIKNDLNFENKGLLGKNRLASKEFIKEQKKYLYNKEGVAVINGVVCYHISFKSLKNKGDFAGNLYINAEDFAIVRYDYKLIEGKLLNSVNLKFLLGIKMNINDRQEFGIFSKSTAGVYYPKYIKTTVSSYTYFDRSLSFSENNDDKKTRKELKIDLMQESNQTAINELLAIEAEAIASIPKFPKYIIGDKQTKYDARYWKNFNIIEATEEVKNYE
jgi:hypothetical protein